MPARRGWLLAAAIGLAALSRAGTAQINPALTEAERGIHRDPADSEAHLSVETMRVDAHVVGRTADVTLELLIGSDQATPAEGTLALLLPADAVVTGYALDVGGTLIPGQLLEAPKARNVYEDEVRAGIDPGLAEVSGNRFTTRIYPIDAAHPRRFRVTFAVPFDPVAGIVLPLGRDGPIAQLDATVRVDGYATAPLIRFAGKTMTLTRDGAGWSGGTDAKAVSLRDGLTIAGGTLAGPIAVTRHAGGERFFVIGDGAAVTQGPARGDRVDGGECADPRDRRNGRALDPRPAAGRLTDTDARIVIAWTADDADIDLWVDEPTGERVMYSNKLSSAGGQISNDMTDGYGPEEYAIHRAPAGAYAVRINGYDGDRINPNGPGHVLIRLQRGFARGSAQETMVDADLSSQQGRNRNEAGLAKPVATLQVGPSRP